jgi:hypothetical protein
MPSLLTLSSCITCVQSNGNGETHGDPKISYELCSQYCHPATCLQLSNFLITSHKNYAQSQCSGVTGILGPTKILVYSNFADYMQKVRPRESSLSAMTRMKQCHEKQLKNDTNGVV